MEILIVIPTRGEFNLFLKSCTARGLQTESSSVGRIPVVRLPDLGITVARGGLGKVQFAVQTQHLLDVHPHWDLVICAGAAGALADDLAVGDVVVATETVEHDILNRFGPPIIPRFQGAEVVISDLASVSEASDAFTVRFGPVASGDEDVIDVERKHALRSLTGGIAVAWEGAGGARACQFSGIPYVEVRGISDSADSDAASDFEANQEEVMRNVSVVVTRWARESLAKVRRQ